MKSSTVRHSAWAIWILGFGYFAFYVPYAGMTKALSSGLLPGLAGPISGFRLLPAVALGSALGMPIFLAATGWWKWAGRRRILGVEVPLPGRWPLLSALFTAVIIGTTTLNYTFAGVSIVFVLLMMRGGVLVLSPIVDALHRRRVRWYSWTALTVSLTAVAVALSDVGSYALTLVAAVNLGCYLGGYVGRFEVMSRHAKVADEAVNRRYFVEEHMASTPMLVALLAVAAVIAPGEIGADLRAGFTTFLLSPAAIPALAIGLLYEGLFIFGSLIYLDHREYTYCVPVNRASSLVAGLVAAYALSLAFGHPPPTGSALAGLGLILVAVAFLAVPPALEARAAAAGLTAERAAGRMLQGAFLFVCGGNTSRSPMAAALCSAEIAARLGIPADRLDGGGVGGVWVASAGVAAHAGAPLSAGARRALGRLGIAAPRHRARPVTADLIGRAEAIFCMTEAQRQNVLALAPEAVAKTFRLDPEADVEDPEGRDDEVYLRCARRLRELVGARLGAGGGVAVAG